MSNRSGKSSIGCKVQATKKQSLEGVDGVMIPGQWAVGKSKSRDIAGKGDYHGAIAIVRFFQFLADRRTGERENLNDYPTSLIPRGLRGPEESMSDNRRTKPGVAAGPRQEVVRSCWFTISFLSTPLVPIILSRMYLTPAQGNNQ